MVSNQKMFFIYATNMWLQRKCKYNFKPDELQTSLKKMISLNFCTPEFP